MEEKKIVSISRTIENKDSVTETEDNYLKDNLGIVKDFFFNHQFAFKSTKKKILAKIMIWTSGILQKIQSKKSASTITSFLSTQGKKLYYF